MKNKSKHDILMEETAIEVKSRYKNMCPVCGYRDISDMVVYDSHILLRSTYPRHKYKPFVRVPLCPVHDREMEALKPWIKRVLWLLRMVRDPFRREIRKQIKEFIGYLREDKKIYGSNN